MNIHSSIARTPPAQVAEPDAALARLERLRGLLKLDGASLERVTSNGVQLLAASGLFAGSFPGVAALQQRATGSSEPLVVTDMPGDQRGAVPIRFLAVIPIATAKGAMVLTLCDSKPRSQAMADKLVALTSDVINRATIARQRAYLEQRRQQFDRASATARIGIWECDLLDNNRLTWTNGVYDLFELPHGSSIDRGQTVERYTERSRREMELVRAKAIAEGSDFRLDAEIITAKGNRRWMRLTGTVERENGVAVRIFGMKQDITEEKLLADRTRYLAEFDVMTGLANRSQFQNRLDDIDGTRHGRPIFGLLLVDLDGFKQVNDTHGHAVGDECLKEAAVRLTESCAGAELVARIGGDEFAILLGAELTQGYTEGLAQRIVAMIGRPLTRRGKTLTLGASVGVAHHRGGSGEELFRNADTALYAAKAAGRNTSRTFRAA